MSEKILDDISLTIDQLVETAELIKAVSVGENFEHELEVLEKTQESLLARLMHRQSLLDTEKRSVMLKSIRKEEIQRQVLKSFPQKPARSRKARSKSSG